jgi:membrane protein implicated in regulation of membrane protease activity
MILSNIGLVSGVVYQPISFSEQIVLNNWRIEMKTEIKAGFIAALILLLIAGMYSCQSTRNSGANAGATSASENLGNREKTAGKIGDKVKGAKDELISARNKVAEGTEGVKKKDKDQLMVKEVKTLEEAIAHIVTIEAKLQGVVEDLDDHKKALAGDKAKIKAMEEADKKKEADWAKKEANYKKQLETSNSKYMRVLIILSIVLIGLGVAACFYTRSWQSLAISIFGVVVLIASLSVQHYSEKYASLGFAVVAVVIAMIAYAIYVQLKERKDKNQIEKEKHEIEEDFSEVVETVELVKEKLPEGEKVRIFGTKNSDGLSATIQSKRTKGRVLESRKNINEKNKPTMEG